MNKSGMDPTIFSLTAIIVGMIASDNMPYPELNALGNWFVLLGDYLLTYAAEEYVIDQKKQRDSDYNEKVTNKNNMDYLYDAIKKLEKEIEKIKKET